MPVAAKPERDGAARGLRFASLLLALCAGAVSCFPSDYGVTPYVLNLTRASVPVHVRSLDGTPDCALLPMYLPALDASAFGPATRYELAPAGVLPLRERNDSACGAARVRIAGEEHLVQWTDEGLTLVPEHPTRGHESAAQAMHVMGAASAPHVVIGEHLAVAQADPSLEQTCTAPIEPALDWSGLVPGTHTLHALRVGVDGCLQAELGGAAGLVRTAFLCMPEDRFPFVAGDVLEIEIEASARPAWDLAPVEQVRITAHGRSLELLRGVAPAQQLGTSVGPLLAAACAPVRDGCGSYAVPAQIPMDGTLRSAGDTVFTRDASGRAVLVRLGRVERVVLAGTRCDGQERPGERVDLVMLGDAPSAVPDGDHDAGQELDAAAAADVEEVRDAGLP